MSDGHANRDAAWGWDPLGLGAAAMQDGAETEYDDLIVEAVTRLEKGASYEAVAMEMDEAIDAWMGVPSRRASSPSARALEFVRSIAVGGSASPTD
jgi:hypothetical protein